MRILWNVHRNLFFHNKHDSRESEDLKKLWFALIHSLRSKCGHNFCRLLFCVKTTTTTTITTTTMTITATTTMTFRALTEALRAQLAPFLPLWWSSVAADGSCCLRLLKSKFTAKRLCNFSLYYMPPSFSIRRNTIAKPYQDLPRHETQFIPANFATLIFYIYHFCRFVL